MHPRTALGMNSETHTRTSWKFLTDPTFYTFHVANIVFSSRYGLPQTYLPIYVRQVLHLRPVESSLMLACFTQIGTETCKCNVGSYSSFSILTATSGEGVGEVVEMLIC